MNFFILGATGFVGTALCRHLLVLNHEVVALGQREKSAVTPDEKYTYIRGNAMLPGQWQTHIESADVIVNLAGESVLQRWTAFKRSRMWKSRVYTTRNLLENLHSGQTLVNISATGYYGDRGSASLSETSEPGGGFLSELCQAWEESAKRATSKGVRVAIGRLGVVLGNGGALQKMLPVFKLGMGGRLGSGHQWMPWIHVDDVTEALVTMAVTPDMSGTFNLVAPSPVTNRRFTEVLGNVLNVPTIAPVPKMILNMVLGEASRVMLDSQRVFPVALLEKGFVFQYPNLEDALTSLVA